MRTQQEIETVYFNLSDAHAKIAAKHIEGIKNGYEMNSEFNALVHITNLKKCFDTAWAYLDNTQKNKICDLSGTFFYN